MSRRMRNPGQPLQVLVVEDEPRLRDILVAAIPDMGFAVRGVSRGSEAMAELEQEPPDIAVLDLNLPDIDGIELFERMRERCPLVQVIILTGFGDLDAARTAIRLEVVDFLTKPASLGELEVALDRARRRIAERAGTHAIALANGDDPNRVTIGTIQDVERDHILAVLNQNHGNRAATAAELGISVRTLYYRIAEYHRQGHDV